MAGATGDGPQPWEVGEVLSEAWTLFKDNAGLLIGAFAATIAVMGVLQAVGHFIGAAPVGDAAATANSAVILTFNLVSYATKSWLTVGAQRINLAVVRNEPIEFSELFGGGNRALTMFGTGFLMALGIGGATLLLIIPGIIVALGWQFALFYVADTDTGAIEALGASWKATHGQRGALFSLALALVLVNVVGLLACGVGLLASIPVSGLAVAIVFTRISGRKHSGALSQSDGF